MPVALFSKTTTFLKFRPGLYVFLPIFVPDIVIVNQKWWIIPTGGPELHEKKLKVRKPV